MAPVDPLDELLELAASVEGVRRGCITLDVGSLRGTRLYVVDAAGLIITSAPSRQVSRIICAPGPSEQLTVDIATGVAAALAPPAAARVDEAESAMQAAQRALDSATQVRDKAAALRDRIVAIRDEGIARACAARGG